MQPKTSFVLTGYGVYLRLLDDMRKTTDMLELSKGLLESKIIDDAEAKPAPSEPKETQEADPPSGEDKPVPAK